MTRRYGKKIHGRRVQHLGMDTSLVSAGPGGAGAGASHSPANNVDGSMSRSSRPRPISWAARPAASRRSSRRTQRRRAPRLRLASRTGGGAPGNGASAAPSLTAGGTWVVFESDATDVGVTTTRGPDTNGVRDAMLATEPSGDRWLLGERRRAAHDQPDDEPARQLHRVRARRPRAPALRRREVKRTHPRRRRRGSVGPCAPAPRVPRRPGAVRHGGRASRPRRAAKRAATPRLKAFTSCAGLIGYARRHAPPPRLLLPPRRRSRAAGPRRRRGRRLRRHAAPGHRAGAGRRGADSSTTNVQEAGVDEPDIVKSDGTNVFALTGGGCTPPTRAARPAPARARCTIRGYGGELLLQGRRALTISSGGAGHDAHRGRRRQPGGDARAAHAQRRRRAHQLAPARPHRARRRRLGPARARRADPAADRVRCPVASPPRRRSASRCAPAAPAGCPRRRCATAAPAASASARSSPATTCGARRASPAPGC